MGLARQTDVHPFRILSSFSPAVNSIESNVGIGQSRSAKNRASFSLSDLMCEVGLVFFLGRSIEQGIYGSVVFLTRAYVRR